MKVTNRHGYPWLGMSVTLLALGAAAEVPETQIRSVTLHINAQPIGSALNEFARQSGVQVLFYSDVSDGVSVPGLAGTFAPDVALTKLLSNTGLTFEYVNSRTVAIHRAVSNVSEGASTDGEPERLYMRLASLQVADMPNEGQQSVAAADAQEPDNNKRPGNERRPRGLEEVIVTAQKRVERLQDVPISIAVVSADEIDRRGMVSSEDYLRGIPGINQTTAQLGQSIVIRGIQTATASQNFSTGTTTATYFGETPTTNSAGLLGGTNVDLKVVDIERVEVLRGPQGTAFGNSSMGGAVRTIPVAPKLDHFEGKVAAGYSVTSGTGGDNYNVQAIGNIPLVKDRLAIRATAYQYQDSGFYANRAASDPDFQIRTVVPFDVEAFAIDQDEVGSYYVVGGRVAALFQASDDLRFTLGYLSQKTETDGVAGATSGIYQQSALQVAPEHVIRGETGGLYDTDIDIANAVMEYDFGRANLVATYSYTESGSVSSSPYTGSYGINRPVSDNYNNDHRENVGEIRLATQLDGAWNFLAGVYVEEINDEGLFDNVWHGDPATNIYVNQPRSVGTRLDKRNLKQKAAFGEASWELVQGLTLTGGARTYRYDRTFWVRTSGPIYAGARADDDTNASGEIFRANLSYKSSDDSLIYAGWSQGFRLGQLQLPLPAGTCDRNGDGLVDGTSITIDSTGEVSSDAVDSFEVGGKFAFLDRRLTIEADVFRMDWSDLPVRIAPGTGTCVLAYVENAGEALSEGVEFQAKFQVTEPFRIDFGGSFIDARLTKDVPAQGFSAGDRLPGSPEFNANLGLQYEFEIGDYKAFARADSIYVGEFYGDVLESPNTKSGNYVKLDASTRLEIGNLNLDLFVDNLTNQDAFTFRGSSGAVGRLFGYRLRPRTIGLQLSYTF